MRLARMRRTLPVVFGSVTLVSGAWAPVESAPGPRDSAGPGRTRGGRGHGDLLVGGPQLSRPNAIAVDAEGRVTVSDEGVIAVFDLDPATGELTVLADVNHGSGAPLPQDIEPGVLTEGVEDAAIDANGDPLVIGLTEMLHIDRTTGVRTVIAGSDVGSGASVAFGSTLAVESAGTILAAQTWSGAVVRVDPLTRQRTIVSGCETGACVGAGIALHRPEGMAVRGDGVIYVADTPGVLRVDPLTGDRTVVSGAGVGTGEPLGSPTALALEPSGTLVWARQEGLLRIDPATGNRTALSGFGAGAGPAFRYAADVAVLPEGTVLVADRGLSAVVRVDPATGDRTLLAGGPVGSGPAFGPCPGGSALEAAGALAVTDCEQGVVRVDLASGNRALVSGANRGQGPAFAGAIDVAVEPSGRLLVLDGRSVKRVDAVSGNRTVVANAGTGAPIIAGAALRLEPGGHAVVADAGQFVAPGAGLFVFPLQLYAGLLRIDVATGGSETLSGGGLLSRRVGGGPSFVQPIRAMDLEAGGTAAVLRENDLMRVDLATGDRQILSRGQDTEEWLHDLAVDADGSWLLLDRSNNRIERFDPSTGARTIVSGLTAGAGPQLESPTAMHVAADGRILVANFGRSWDFGDQWYATIIAVDPATGNRTIVSRY